MCADGIYKILNSEVSVANFCCDICNVNCCSASQLDKHLDGAKHKRKAEQLRFMKLVEEKDPMVFCDVCKIALPEQFMLSHKEGSKHKRKNMDNGSVSDAKQYENATFSYPETVLDSDSCHQAMKNQSSDQFLCELCCLSFGSQMVLDDHLKGLMHTIRRNNLRRLQMKNTKKKDIIMSPKKPDSSGAVECVTIETFDLVMESELPLTTTGVSLDAEVVESEKLPTEQKPSVLKDGKEDQSLALLFQKCCIISENDFVDTNYSENHSNCFQQQTKNIDKTLLPECPIVSNNLRRCDFCEITCSDNNQFNQHLQGIKHKRKEERVKFMELVNQKDPSVFCEICDITLSQQMMEIHKDGIKHKRKAHNMTEASSHDKLVTNRNEKILDHQIFVDRCQSPKRLYQMSDVSCDVCKKTYPSQVQYESHLKGFKHYAAVNWNNPCPEGEFAIKLLKKRDFFAKLKEFRKH